VDLSNMRDRKKGGKFTHFIKHNMEHNSMFKLKLSAFENQSANSGPPQRGWRTPFASWAKVGTMAAAFSMGSILPLTGLTATIQGTIFNDLNDSGSMDQGETGEGFANQAVYFRNNTDRSRFQVVTGNDGSFSAENLSAGSYTLWIRIPTLWTQTTPVIGTGIQPYTVSLAEGQPPLTVDFGVRDPNAPIPVPNSLPQVSVDRDTVTVQVGVEATFNGGFTDVDSADTHSVVWTFSDDGSTANSLTATHTFASVGDHTATLTVTDSQGGVGTETVQIEVTPVPNTPPAVNAGGNMTVFVGTNVDFDGSFTDVDTTDTHIIQWTFGDGGTANALATTHTYTSPGNYTVTLTVTDSQGGVGSSTVQVVVNPAPNTPPTVNVSGDMTVNTGESITFNAIVNDPDINDTHDFAWNFGDSNTASTQRTSHSYAEIGTYVATLTVTDSQGGVGTGELSVTVLPIFETQQPETATNVMLLDGIPVTQHNTITVAGDYYLSPTGERIDFHRLEEYLLAISIEGAPSIQFGYNNQNALADSDNPFNQGKVYKFADRAATEQAFVQFQEEASIAYTSPLLTTDEGGLLAVTNQIVLKRPSGISESAFITQVQGEGLNYVRKLRLSEDEYIFAITSSYDDIGDIFSTARSLNNRAFIQWSEPSFLTVPIFKDIPNDPLFNNQWHLNNINATDGWDIATGAEMVIAINDDGVDLTHEDIVIWTNPNEIAGNGIDDDNNGYIDDVNGWDFAQDDNDPDPGTDSGNEHGTAVAGVAAAQGNNALGVSGSARDAVVLPIRIGGGCPAIAESIRYSAKYAHVANHSWSIPGCQLQINSAINDAITGNIPGGSVRGTLGTPLLFASGNSAAGWYKFTIPVQNAGVYSFRWKFSKNTTGSEGEDTTWIDDIIIPGNPTFDFESDNLGDIPDNFTSNGDAQWRVVSDGIHARGATGKSVKAGTITHNQETNLDLINVAVNQGDLSFWVWVSSEGNADYFEFFYSVNGGGTWQFLRRKTPQSGHTDAVSYPASNPNTIAVGASNDASFSGLEERSHYSQYGPELDVVAPSNGGEQGITTTDQTGNAGYNPARPNNLANLDYTNSFGGTSSATPLTSGVVAVMLSYNPNLTLQEVRDCLREGADEIGPYPYSGDRNDFYGFGRVNLEGSLACVPPPSTDPCEAPTVRSVSSGNWETGSTWSTGVHPTPGSRVLIQANHTVTAPNSSNATDPNAFPYSFVPLDGLCIENGATLISEANLSHNSATELFFQTNTLYNYGNILGTNGLDGEGCPDPHTIGSAGSDVSIFATTFVNGVTGKIQGGRGGHDRTYLRCQNRTLEARGGAGGKVSIDVTTFTNEGRIGPMIQYSHSAPADDEGGNGGAGDNFAFVNGTRGNDGNAVGGSGGNTEIYIFDSGINTETGRICSGNGGLANVDYGYTPTAGNAGDLILPPQLVNEGDLCVGEGIDGVAYWEPYTIKMSGSNARLHGGVELRIFGDDVTIELTDLREGAISTEGTIILATGPGGTVNLKGNEGQVLQAGEGVEIFADTILLDEGETLEDVIDTPSIVTQPGKILYHAVLSGKRQIVAEPNTTIPVTLRLLNNSPVNDTYTLSVTDLAGWNLSGLPNTISIESLKKEELTLNITFPETRGVKNTITINAASHGDPELIAILEMQVAVATEDEFDGNENTGGGEIGTGDGTGTGETGTGETGSGETGSGETGSGGTGSGETGSGETGSGEISTGGDGIDDSGTGDDPIIIGKYTVYGTILSDGAALKDVEVTVAGITVTTNEVGYWEISGLLEDDNYTVTSTKDGYTFTPIEFALGNELRQEVSIKPVSDLQVDFIAEPRKPQLGENVTYMITVTNGGEKTATGVVLSDVLPENVELLSIETLDGGNCEATTVTCNLPNLTTGDFARVKLVIGNNQGNRLENQVQVTSNEYPTDIQIKRISVTANLSVEVTCSPKTIMPQAELNCTATVQLSEYAASAATGVELVVTLPQGVQLNSDTLDSRCVSNTPTTFTCALEDLSVSGSGGISQTVVNFTETLQDPGLLLLINQAQVSANEYPMDTDRARTKIYIPPEYQVDMALVIDVTGSMQEEMNGAKAGIIDFVNAVNASNAQFPLSVLIVFRDEVTVTAVTKDMDILIDAIGDMAAAGGGMCPEASAEALEIAIRHVKAGGTIALVTDASPYEDADLAAISKALTDKAINFNPFVTGDCSDEESWNILPNQP